MQALAERTEFVADAAGLMTDPAEAFAFMSAGNATFTLRSKVTGTRFTYKVRASDDGSISFVSLMTGSDNENGFSYFGLLRRNRFMHGGAKDRFIHGGAKARVGATAPSVRAFSWVWMMLSQGRMPHTLEVWHEGRCGRCNRKLTDPVSIGRGIGPECYARRGI